MTLPSGTWRQGEAGGALLGCGLRVHRRPIMLWTNTEVRWSLEVSVLMYFCCPELGGICPFVSHLKWELVLALPKVDCVLTFWPLLCVHHERKWLVSNKPLFSILSYFILFFSYLCYSEQPWPQPAACEEMGLLSGGGAERSGRTRPVPEVPGVRVQLREPAVRLSL